MFRTKAVKKMETRILCCATVFRKSCLLRDNGEKYCRVWRATDVSMAQAHCIPKATNTHAVSYFFIFPLQQWLHERTSLLRYTFTALSCKYYHHPIYV